MPSTQIWGKKADIWLWEWMLLRNHSWISDVECGPGKTEAQTIHETPQRVLLQFIMHLKDDNIGFLKQKLTLFW